MIGVVENLVNRRKTAGIVLIVLGLFMLFGSWRFESTGDAVNVFPFWFWSFGAFVMTCGLYLYVVNLLQEKIERGLRPPRKSP